jgi:hypothetical protein
MAARELNCACAGSTPEIGLHAILEIRASNQGLNDVEGVAASTIGNRADVAAGEEDPPPME